MEVTGTVTKTRRVRASYGSVYLSTDIETSPGRTIRLRYLQSFVAVPARGDHVTITGMPMMLTPKRGRSLTPNIGGVRVQIHREGS